MSLTIYIHIETEQIMFWVWKGQRVKYYTLDVVSAMHSLGIQGCYNQPAALQEDPFHCCEGRISHTARIRALHSSIWRCSGSQTEHRCDPSLWLQHRSEGAHVDWGVNVQLVEDASNVLCRIGPQRRPTDHWSFWRCELGDPCSTLQISFQGFWRGTFTARLRRRRRCSTDHGVCLSRMLEFLHFACVQKMSEGLGYSYTQRLRMEETMFKIFHPTCSH